MPHTVNNLASQIYDFDNIYAAYLEVSRKKRYKTAFQVFCLTLEEQLISIQNDLVWRSYNPSGTVSFQIREPKLRNITRPELRDRIIHHALIRVTLPYFDQYFHQSSFACRKGMGQLSACLQWQKAIRSALGGFGKSFHIIAIDIKSFFASIDHATIKFMLRRLFSDDFVIWLFDMIIDSVPEGIPIGFLPSQHEANLIGTIIDYFVTDILGVSHYVRYADDVRIACESRAEAVEILQSIDNLASRIQLRLHPQKTRIYQWSGRDTFCGYVIAPHHLDPKKATVKRAEKRLLKKLYQYQTGSISLQQLKDTTTPLVSYLSHTGDKYNATADLCMKVWFSDIRNASGCG